MKAKEFDEKFDRGEDVTQALDRDRVRRPGLEQKRVNVDFPVWMIESLDREARRRGVTRQSIIKMWLADKLKESSNPSIDEKS
jgi:hypothetical protein